MNFNFPVSFFHIVAGLKKSVPPDKIWYHRVASLQLFPLPDFVIREYKCDYDTEQKFCIVEKFSLNSHRQLILAWDLPNIEGCWRFLQLSELCSIVLSLKIPNQLCKNKISQHFSQKQNFRLRILALSHISRNEWNKIIDEQDTSIRMAKMVVVCAFLWCLCCRHRASLTAPPAWHCRRVKAQKLHVEE